MTWATAASSLTPSSVSKPSAGVASARPLPGWRRHSPLAWLLIGFVVVWRKVVSPLYGDVCKFHPTCSEYGLVALQTHGAIRGSWLTARRLVRCHPWSLGGVDPVPPAPDAPRHAFPTGPAPAAAPATEVQP